MNKAEFLSAICGKPVDRVIDGIPVKIRSVTVLETQEISKVEGDEIEAALQLCFYGLVEPKLDKEDLVILRNATAGFIMKLAKEISDLSGLGEQNPTVGN